MSCGLIYLIVAVILGLYWGFRDEINDLLRGVLGIRMQSTHEKERFEFQVWYNKLSAEERESFRKIAQDPLGREADPPNPGDDDPAAPVPD